MSPKNMTDQPIIPCSCACTCGTTQKVQREVGPGVNASGKSCEKHFRNTWGARNTWGDRVFTCQSHGKMSCDECTCECGTKFEVLVLVKPNTRDCERHFEKDQCACFEKPCGAHLVHCRCIFVARIGSTPCHDCNAMPTSAFLCSNCRCTIYDLCNKCARNESERACAICNRPFPTHRGGCGQYPGDRVPRDKTDGFVCCKEHTEEERVAHLLRRAVERGRSIV